MVSKRKVVTQSQLKRRTLEIMKDKRLISANTVDDVIDTYVDSIIQAVGAGEYVNTPFGSLFFKVQKASIKDDYKVVVKIKSTAGSRQRLMMVFNRFFSVTSLGETEKKERYRREDFIE